MTDAPKTINLSFDSGYYREPNISGLPAASGIYCVYACTYDAEAKTVDVKRLLYIGEAANVKERVDGHEGWAAWKKQLASGQVVCLSAAKISTDRERAEAAMIFQHQPPCNTSNKDSFGFDTTTINVSGKAAALLSKSFTVKKGATKS